MGYDLKPKNADIEWFPFGAFSWPVLVEACGYLFPAISKGAKWYCVSGADPRMPEGDDYPSILSNDGMEITAEEARIMARMARNYVAVQRSLPEENRDPGLRGKAEFNKEDVEAAVLRGMHEYEWPWPSKIRDDFTDRLEEFADWAEQPEGFEIH